MQKLRVNDKTETKCIFHNQKGRIPKLSGGMRVQIRLILEK